MQRSQQHCPKSANSRQPQSNAQSISMISNNIWTQVCSEPKRHDVHTFLNTFSTLCRSYSSAKKGSQSREKKKALEAKWKAQALISPNSSKAAAFCPEQLESPFPNIMDYGTSAQEPKPLWLQNAPYSNLTAWSDVYTWPDHPLGTDKAPGKLSDMSR